MIRIIGTLASLAWLVFMMWGAVREYRASHPRLGDASPGTRLLLGQLTGWLTRRYRRVAERNREAPPPV
jgi:hypothetical protein